MHAPLPLYAGRQSIAAKQYSTCSRREPRVTLIVQLDATCTNFLPRLTANLCHKQHQSPHTLSNKKHSSGSLPVTVASSTLPHEVTQEQLDRVLRPRVLRRRRHPLRPQRVVPPVGMHADTPGATVRATSHAFHAQQPHLSSRRYTVLILLTMQ